MAITAKTYDNVLKFGTQAAYEAMQSHDPSVLYFTDAGKLYKGDLDITNGTRVVSVRPTSPLVGITYVIETATSTTVETFDGTDWHVISYALTTTVSNTSTDTQVPTAKAVFSAIQETNGAVGDLDDLETTNTETIVGAINEVNKIANDNATAIGVAPTETEAGSGILKDIADINDEIDALGTAAHEDVATVDIGAQGEVTTALPTVGQVKDYVAKEVADLEGAMHFRAAITPVRSGEGAQTDEQAMDAWYAAESVTPAKGDVFVITDNTKEYIVSAVADSGVTYKEIGAEGLFVLKTTTIAGVDLNDNISKEEMLTALNVADGAQVNVLEGVKVNGAALTVDSDKNVNVTVAEGSANGTIAVNGADVNVHGLGSMAYEDKDDYDAAGTAETLVGDLSTLATEDKTDAVTAINEVHGAVVSVQGDADQNAADINALSVAVGWGTFGTN